MTSVGIFLDRDGTINEETDFIRSSEELHLLPRAADAIRLANEAGWKVVVVTNQSGIARGYLTEATLAEIHARLTGELQRQNAYIDAIYYCPHHPEEGNGQYRKACDCRKPLPGMLHRASRELGIDLTASFVVGDRMIDMQLAHAVGAVPILVLTGYGRAEAELCRTHDVQVGYVAEDLYDAVTYAIAVHNTKTA